jgi:peptidoglycan/LPS O-acetylase OafA/YrhL
VLLCLLAPISGQAEDVDEWFERSPFVGFAPWIIYWVVADGPSTWMFGAICAVIAALTLGVSAGRGGPRLLEVVTIVFFVVITIAGMVVGAENRDWMDTYATTLSSGVLAAMSLGSLAFVPFTAQYAPEFGPQQDWEKAAFRRTNRVLTLMWTLVFALIAVLGYVAVKAPDTTNWTKAVIPVVVIVGAIGMTQIYPTRARENARPV